MSKCSEAAAISKLANLLNERQIAPFTKESVNQYMRQKLPKMPRDERCARLTGLSICLLISALLGFAFLCSASERSCVHPATLFVLSAIAGCIAVACLAGLIVLNWRHPFSAYDMEWQFIPINRYSRPIPLAGVRLAVDIAQAIPESQLYVAEFGERQLPDPFLMCKIGSEVFYLYCWKEPGFSDSLLIG